MWHVTPRFPSPCAACVAARCSSDQLRPCTPLPPTAACLTRCAACGRIVPFRAGSGAADVTAYERQRVPASRDAHAVGRRTLVVLDLQVPQWCTMHALAWEAPSVTRRPEAGARHLLGHHDTGTKTALSGAKLWTGSLTTTLIAARTVLIAQRSARRRWGWPRGCSSGAS